MRGSLARVGLLPIRQMAVAEVRATVGRFISIRCATSTIVAMITDVSCEDLPSSDNYVATAGVDSPSTSSSAGTGFSTRR